MISKTIRDKLFVRKVWDFLRACPKFNDLERLEFVREHLEDPKKAEKLGNAIVLILDKLDDLEKPEMLAKAFAALVRNKINPEIFRRLASAIDIGFLEDLKAFAELREVPPAQLTTLYTNLLRTGLTELKGPRIPSEKGMPKVVCDVTELGRLFNESSARTQVDLAMQTEIVRRVEGLFALAHQSEQRLNKGAYNASFINQLRRVSQQLERFR
jgi:hypothetical protein